eukprot:TRINITY_DN31217_c0_g1_i2.p1 TRINITY_DN31217_c0_g1~~TRINITY_DN31217_c0_g1_i2.p1  ORF type:complete len:223 (+),score=79.75 TRINITY_DN31217_c0_g1_i2:94-762(+)
MPVYYAYDRNGFWRCDRSGSKGGDLRRHDDDDGGWRRRHGWQWRRDWTGSGGSGREDQLEAKMNTKITALEKKFSEPEEVQKATEAQKKADELKVKITEQQDVEDSWRWWMEWRLMSVETMVNIMEQREKSTGNDVQANHAKAMAELQNSFGRVLAAVQNTVDANREMTMKMEKLMAVVENNERSKAYGDDAKNAKENYSKIEGVLQHFCDAMAKKLGDLRI